jgi:hypothetical protein
MYKLIIYRYFRTMDSIPASPQQILARRNLLNVLLSSFDVILEFDPTTGGLKNWAW